MSDNFLNEGSGSSLGKRHLFRLHRKLFVLVFAIAVLWQGLLLMECRLSQYYNELESSFKVILTVREDQNNTQLAQLGESLNQKQDIISVRLFSPQDGLEEVRRQNPQLTEALLLMGRNKMPAYFELKLSAQTMGNIRPFVDNLAAEYEDLTPHYNAQHASFIFYTGVSLRLLRIGMIFAGFLFLLFMFLVEAQPVRQEPSHMWTGALSGALAWIGAAILLCILIYPTGFLQESLQLFSSMERQILGAVFCALLGWTLSKWQKF